MANFATKIDPLSLFVQNIETAHRYGSGQASSEMVGSRNRWHFSNTFYNIFGQTSHLDHFRTFLKFFPRISHLPTFSHVSWWTALRMAKTTRRRRQAKSLISYHFGWIFFSNWDVIYCSGFGCHNFS